MNWLPHWLGIDSTTSNFYAFWSGISGSNIGVIAAVVIFTRRHTCHVRGCWRFGHHPVDGTSWCVCRRHHPDLPNRAPSATDVAVASEGRPQ